MGKAFSFILIAFLFVGAVLAAGASVTASYQAGQLELREQAALSRQRVLKEELARAGSIQLVLRYAQEQGFTQSGGLSTLRLGAALAQR